MDAENACNGGKANGSHLDNGRVNEFQSACSIRCLHDPNSLHRIFFAKLAASKYFSFDSIVSVDFPEQYIMIRRWYVVN